jgi:hypothetical protein
MRIGLLLWLIFMVVAPSKGQSEGPDPYSIKAVAGALAMRSDGRSIIISVMQKQLARLGDGVSVALLKILDQHELADAQKVRDILPIIRDSFAEPQFIAVEADKKPRITVFLLNYLLQNVSDTQVLHEIQETMEFVEKQTAD